MIAYLVCCSEERGIADCMERGWIGIARLRYVTPEKDDVRIVRRASDLVPLAGKTPMLRGSDYEDGPASDDEQAMNRWIKEKDVFDSFVASGAGEWIDLPK
jgi:hypothetical protein